MLSTLAVSFENLGDVSLEAALAAMALLGTVTVWLVDRLLFQRRRLAYRVQMDAPLDVTPSTDLVDVELRSPRHPRCPAAVPTWANQPRRARNSPTILLHPRPGTESFICSSAAPADSCPAA